MATARSAQCPVAVGTRHSGGAVPVTYTRRVQQHPAAGRPRGRATVYDVARHAGVSIKTVSRVVNDAAAVSEATRLRVQEAIAATAYVPNATARSLKFGVGETIGLVVDSIADPWFAELTAAVEEHALAAGMTVMIGSSGRDSVRMAGLIERLVQQRIRGLILAPIGDEAAFLPQTVHDLPVVCVDRKLPGREYDVVRVADRAAAKAGVEHLIAHGHRRIAFFGDNIEVSTIVLRRQGYRDALRSKGIPVDDTLIMTDCGETPVAAVRTEQILRDDPSITAIFASNARAAVGVTSALHRLGRTDIAFVSFGDFPLAQAVSPAVTVISQDPRPVGRRAAELLKERIDGVGGPGRDLRMPTPIVTRGSGELPAMATPLPAARPDTSRRLVAVTPHA